MVSVAHPQPLVTRNIGNEGESVMPKVSMLPEGLTFKKVDRGTRKVSICQRRLDGPEFAVEIKYMSYKTFRDAAVAASNLRARANDPDEAERAAFQPMLEKVVVGWDGATFQNVNYVLRADSAIRPESDSDEATKKFIKDYVEGQKTFPFNIGLFVMLWFQSYPEKFQNMIFEELRNWEDGIEEKAEKGKDD